MQLLHSSCFCCFLILSTANTDLGIRVAPPSHPRSLQSYSFFHCAGQVTFRVLDQQPYHHATSSVENCVSTRRKERKYWIPHHRAKKKKNLSKLTRETFTFFRTQNYIQHNIHNFPFLSFSFLLSQQPNGG